MTIILSCIGGFLVGYISVLVLLMADTEDDEVLYDDDRRSSGLLEED